MIVNWLTIPPEKEYMTFFFRYTKNDQVVNDPIYWHDKIFQLIGIAKTNFNPTEELNFTFSKPIGIQSGIKLKRIR